MFLLNLLFFLILFSLSYSENKTIFVFEHFRHGARGPIIEDKIFNEKYIGTGELTNVGARMHYLLGQHNKHIYIKNKKFISKNFIPDEFLIYSTNTNRTIDSVNNQLLGMFSEENENLKLIKSQNKNSIPYYLNKNHKIKEKINELNDISISHGTQVFPIHVLNIGNTFIPYFTLNNCPKSLDLVKENIKKNMKEIERTKKILLNNKILNDNINNIKKEEELVTIITQICDFSIVGYTDGRILNKTKNINVTQLYTECNYFNKLLFTKIYVKDKENQISKITMSHLMNIIIQFIEKRIKLNEEKKGDLILKNHPKFFIYSGHDTTLSQLQDFLTLIFNSNVLEIPFASNLFLEVIKNEKNNKYYVKVIYNDKELFEIEYNEFKKKVENNILTNQEIIKLCQNKKKSFNLLFYIFLICNLLLLFIIFIIWYQKKNYNENDDSEKIISFTKLTAE